MGYALSLALALASAAPAAPPRAKAGALSVVARGAQGR